LGTERKPILIDAMDSNTSAPAAEGVLGSVQPSREQQGDIEFGWPLLEQIVELRIGSAMAVRERDVIAVQATEDTASLIERAGALCRTKGWVLLRTSAAGRETGADVPAIGVEMIRLLAGAGGGCLAVGAGRVGLVDEAMCLEAADRARIAVVGVAGRVGP
jgi:DUF1009 family protein